MTYRYDLIAEPWVPCVTDDGRVEELGLCNALVQAHRFRELGGESPLVTAALYRLLLAILHRVFGPEDRDAWGELWARKRWDATALDAYFARWRHRFDLFDEDRPFFQAAYPGAKPKSIVSLVHHLASGNNPVLFDHHTESVGVSLSPAEAARALVAAQSFGLGGLSGFPDKFTDGSCARGILFLVVGDTLFETLMLNLPRRLEEDDPLGLTKPDLPCWEMEDPLNLEGGRPYGLQDRYTWQNRRICLLGPDVGPSGPRVREMTWGPGLRLSEEAITQDPMKYYRQDPNGWKMLRFQEDRALWRDSAPLFRLPRGASAEDSRPPQALDELARLLEFSDVQDLSSAQTKRLLALGMANDQAKVEFYRREELPLPLELLHNQELVSHLEAALAEAEAVRKHLWGALSTLACWILFHEDKKLSRPASDTRDNLVKFWGGERHYWGALEPAFFTLLADLPHTPQDARHAWAVILRRAAWDALEQIITNLGADPASLKAAVMARAQLGAGLAKTLELWLGHAEQTTKEDVHA